MARAPTMEPLHRTLGLTDEEYEQVRAALGRDPNRTELAMYSVMWSEHCSYKSSKIHLKVLPTEGPRVLVGPGEDAFADCHTANPTVNVMCVGLAPVDRLMRGRAEGEGNLLVLIGSRTGRDGIGGVSVLASRTLEGDAEASRPSVQIGDPFTEK